MFLFVLFFKQKTAYEMRISDWSSDVCSSDLVCCRDRRWPRPRCLNRPDCRCGTVAHHGLPSCCIPLPSHLLTWLSSPWSCTRRIGYSCFCRCHLDRKSVV